MLFISRRNSRAIAMEQSWCSGSHGLDQPLWNSGLSPDWWFVLMLSSTPPLLPVIELNLQEILNMKCVCICGPKLSIDFCFICDNEIWSFCFVVSL